MELKVMIFYKFSGIFNNIFICIWSKDIIYDHQKILKSPHLWSSSGTCSPIISGSSRARHHISAAADACTVYTVKVSYTNLSV